MPFAILCSGQAGQRCDMLDAILADPRHAALCAAAGRVLGEDVTTWWAALTPRALFENAHAQFAIALYQLAVWDRIAPSLPDAARVAGYSLGEITAWHVAGALDAEATLRLVHARARLMDLHAPPGGAAGCLLLWRGRAGPARRASRDRAMAATGIDIAIARGDHETVLGGPAEALDTFLAQPGIADPDLKRLPVSIPSHTHYLEGAVEPFAAALASSPLGTPHVPVLAGIDARSLRSREDGIVALSRQVAQTIRWDWCMDNLAAAGIDVFLELGPGNDLARQVAAAIPGCDSRSVDEFGCAEAAAEWVRARCR